MNFILKGNAQPVGPRWEEGFNDAYNLSIAGINPFDKIPDWNCRGGQYSNGFAEGRLSGHSEFMKSLGLYEIPSDRVGTNNKLRLN